MKTYLKDMKEAEAWELVHNNSDYMAELYEEMAQDRGEQQSEEAGLILGSDWHKYIDYHDHYNSFYLRVKDPAEMIRNIDKDYLTEAQAERFEKAKSLLDKYENEEDPDKIDSWYYQLETQAKGLLADIEESLHEYENITDDDIKEEFIINLEDNEDYTIGDKNIYRDYVKVFK